MQWKRIKNNFEQVRFLSTEEIAEIGGSEYLYASCDAGNVGKPCLYTIDSNNYSGTCKSYIVETTKTSTTTIYCG